MEIIKDMRDLKQETELNYKYYESQVERLINETSLKHSLFYAWFKSIKKNLVRLPVAFPFGHCLEVYAVKK